MIEIITITKDDYAGLQKTVSSTKQLRLHSDVSQTVIDSSRQELSNNIQQFLADEPNVKYFRQEPRGIASAFNLGLSQCSSEWVWFLNGGDQVHPDLDTCLLKSILTGAGSDVIIFDIEFVKSGTKYSHPPLWALWPPLYWVPHPATLIRRSLFDKYGNFKEEYDIAMDGDLWLRFFSKDTVVDMLSIPVALYDQNGISNTDISKVNREADTIIVKNFKTLMKIWIDRGLYIIKALGRRYI